LNALTSESDGLIANLRRQSHCIQDSTFRVYFDFGNFHTGCVTSVGVVPMGVLHVGVVPVWQLRITNLQNLFVLSAEKA